jgi:hypothetical protein
MPTQARGDEHLRKTKASKYLREVGECALRLLWKEIERANHQKPKVRWVRRCNICDRDVSPTSVSQGLRNREG